MTDKTATERLREMLDECGVEYEAYRDVKNRCITRWRTYHGAFAFFAVEKEGELFVETASDTEHSAICTPEQAIAATLGGGECENLINPWSVHDSSEPDFECSVCHASGHANGNIDGGEYLFCPRCGKAVKR